MVKSHVGSKMKERKGADAMKSMGAEEMNETVFCFVQQASPCFRSIFKHTWPRKVTVNKA